MGNGQSKKIESKQVASKGVHSELLVNGYIKRVQSKLSWSIVPIDVVRLCIDFYCSRIILIYINEGVYSYPSLNNETEPFELCITDFNETSRKYNAKLKLLDLEDHVDEERGLNIMKGAKIQFNKNINLPPCISCDRLGDNERTQYDVIYRYGGTYGSHDRLRTCNALIWKSNIRRHGNRDKTIKIIDYELPVMPLYMKYANIIYTERYSCLYAIGGDSGRDPTVTKLDLSVSHEEINWEAVETKDIESDNEIANEIRFPTRTSCVLIEKDYDEQIWSIHTNGDMNIDIMNLKDGGKTGKQIATDNKCMFARTKSGVLYDKIGGKVYIGGGHSTQHDKVANEIGYLDLEKLKWFNDIPATLMKHNHHPILWKDGELLYIASVKSEGIEWIDLRENIIHENKGWNMYTDTLNTYFDTEIHGYNAYRCRLLR